MQIDSKCVHDCYFDFFSTWNMNKVDTVCFRLQLLSMHTSNPSLKAKRNATSFPEGGGMKD